MTKRRCVAASLAVLLVAAAAAAPAVAEAAEPRFTVLRVDGEDVWVDVGGAGGVIVGSELVLHDVVVATHPVTGKKVRDTFEVGRLRVTVAGKHVAVARPADARAAKRVDVGDELTLAGAPAAAIDPWDAEERGQPVVATPEAGGGLPGPDPARERELARKEAQREVDEELAVRDAWVATLGRPLAERAAIWKAHLEAWPKGRFSPAVRAELGALEAAMDAARRRELDRTMAAAPETPAWWNELPGAAGLVVAGPLIYAPPTRVYEGDAFALALFETVPGGVTQAWLNVRAAGEATYQRVPMTVEAGGALRARVPAGKVRPAGVEYFVEVLAAADAEPVAVVGTSLEPARVAVDASVEPPPPERRRRSRVTIFTDYVDFDGGLAGGHDQYVHFEVDFLYRFRGPVHAMRLGYASMSGDGGPKEDIAAGLCDTGMPATDRCRRVAFNLSYVELEFRLSSLVSLMVRPIVGGGFSTSASDPDFDEFRSALGLRGRLRLGREEETNLAISVGAISGFGTLLEAAFTWDVVPRFPIVLSTQVTDQPVVENFGVRLIADVGWRGLDWFYPSVRLAYQARNIDLAGVSAGLAMNFDW